jgi:Zinc dependent phospholipase C
MRPRRGSRRRARIIALFTSAALSIAVLCPAPRAHAWDSVTHRLVTRLAIAGLPDSPLGAAFQIHEALLEKHAEEPDTVLKKRYGKAEERRHYITLEYYGPNALAELVPDRSAMVKRFGKSLFDRAGTLPWTIEENAAKSASAWRHGDCAAVFRYSGYLAHYVADASQPLHTTRYFDGYPGDEGIHHRIEGAVDSWVRQIAGSAAAQVKVTNLDSLWPAEIAEIRAASQLVPQTIAADRAARAESRGSRGYDRALYARDGAMFVGQVAAAASTLGSIWLYEWRQAGSPAACGPARAAD